MIKPAIILGAMYIYTFQTSPTAWSIWVFVPSNAKHIFQCDLNGMRDFFHWPLSDPILYVQVFPTMFMYLLQPICVQV